MPKPRITGRTRPAPKTAFKKGHKKVGGRKKGTPNKFTGDLRQAVLNAFNSVGGESYLAHCAKKDRRTFVGLLGKLLPTRIGGEKDNPLGIELLTQASSGLSKLTDKELATLQAILAKVGLNAPGATP